MIDGFRRGRLDGRLDALVNKPSGENTRNWKGAYIKKLTKDPWGNDYLYTNPGENGEIDIFSYGADAVPGGEGPNADIGSWMAD